MTLERYGPLAIFSLIYPAWIYWVSPPAREAEKPDVSRYNRWGLIEIGLCS